MTDAEKMETGVTTTKDEPKSDYVAADDGIAVDDKNNTTKDSTVYGTGRKSKLFFWICDMRTAVVALNVLNIIYSLVVALVLSIMFAFQAGPFKFQNVMTVLTSGLVTAAVSAYGLWSAMNWKFCGAVTTTILFLCIFVWRCIKLEWVDMIVTAFLLYPHIVFTYEMKTGVLSPETYPNEEYVVEGGRDCVDMASEYISPQHSFVSKE